MAADLPEALFDENRASTYYPKPVVKRASLVPVTNDFPTFIRPEWDDTGLHPQVFYGSYFLILDENGKGRYGSAYDQWMNMHRQVAPQADPTLWVKVLPPVGYHIDEACVLVTMIPTEDGKGIRESRKAIKPGTLVLKQPGGEFQFVQPKDESKTYYPPEEAHQLGLPNMTVEQFGSWAMSQAIASFRSTMAQHI